ncbi:ergosterol biosynthesis ERG4/ERG24 [Kalaharituber pfeilii]|nr:ergosterol biosynthesis ERG4/ERG24 [Kalaharituber pfeilii]
MWFSWRGLAIYLVWYMVQAVMYAVVPGRIGYGQKTLAGRQLPYQLNGLTCYIITHVAFISAVYYKLIPISIIANNWLGLFVAANMMGYFLTVFAYVKARLFPCHPDDCKFSGSFLYDMFMGVEFNPRLGKLWDFKLFHNGRPGIIAWTLIDISFIFSDLNGNFIIPSTPALLVLLLHTMYVIDFFWHEDWYLRTIDIAHDHFGFYLAWGDTVWLPYMYTMQAQYLYRNQLNLRGDTFGLLELGVLALGLGGYAIFRGSNNQKDTVRHAFNRAAEQDKDVDKELQKHVRIWGRPPTYILAPYRTSDGKSHTSILLTCGYWGLARHMNYLGDMLMATGMGLATQKVVGGGGIVGWWYTVYLIALLVHRVWRCDERCGGKYGAKWKVYREVVRWRILPGVF